MNELSKDMDINVLSQLDQDEPVTKTESATAVTDVFRLQKYQLSRWKFSSNSYRSNLVCFLFEKKLSSTSGGEWKYSPDQLYGWHGGEEDKPEPEQNINLK